MTGLLLALLAGIFFLSDSVAPANPVLAAFALILITAAVLVRGLPRLSLRDSWPYLLYLAALALSWLGSRTTASTVEVGKQLLFLGVIFAVTRIATTERVQRLVVATLVVFAMAIVGQALLFAWQSEQPERLVTYPIVEQWSGYPELGLLAAIFACGTLALTVFGSAMTLRAGAAYMAAFFTVGALFLYSRSAWVTIGIVAVWIGALALYRRKGVRTIAILALCAMGAVVVLQFSPARSALRLSSLSAVLRMQQTEDRLLGWRTGLAMMRDHPVLGVGPGMYRTTYSRYQGAAALARDRDPRELERDRTHAYNLIFHVGAELGVIGLIAYLLLWGRVLWIGLLAAPVELQALAYAVHAMLAAFFVRSQSEHFLANLQTSDRLLLLLAVLFGLAEAIRGTSQSSHATHHAPRQS